MNPIGLLHRLAPLAGALAAAALIAAAAPPSARASCGSAACSVNTDWAAHGTWTEPGLRLDMRLEYVGQDQPRHGDKAVAVGEVPADHDEVHTWNRNLITTADYAFSETWGVTVALPYIDRDHKHIHNDPGAREVEKWHITGLGDMRVLARYQVAHSMDLDSPYSLGIHAGLKLPTGATDVKNGDGEAAERTLQPGTGTTDSILGVFYQRGLPSLKSNWFAQAMRQDALNESDHFKPGSKTTLDVGFRWSATQSLGVLVQLNAQWKDRDSGDQAEPAESGGRFVYVSPGLSFAFTQDAQMYAFYQWAAYQYVNGVQLTADGGAVIGGSLRF